MSPMLSEKDWEAQSDMDTLIRAAEIKESPARMAAAESFASRESKRLADFKLPDSSQEQDGFTRIKA